MKITNLTIVEEEIMQCLWKLDSALMREVMEALPEPKPHPNTVSTYLKILVEKEFLTTEKIGRIFKYSVAIPFENYQNYKLEHFLNDYFNNKPTALVSKLFDLNLLSAEDLHQYFEIKTTVVPKIKKKKKKSAMRNFVDELTEKKKKNKKRKK